MKRIARPRLASARFLSSFALTASITLLAAFSGKAKSHVDLQFWDMIWGPPEYIDTGKALVAQFNQAHPDITVTYRSIPWSNWYQTFVTAIGSGTAPDLSTGAGYQAVQLYDQDAILPLDDVISAWKASGKLDDFLPKTVDTLKYKDHYVALPWAIDIRVWYYRKDLFDQAHVQPPASWQELKAAAQALTNANANQYGLVACGDTLGSHWIYTLMLNNGGGLFTKDEKPDLTSERNLEALRFLSDLVQSHCVNPASPGYKDDDAISAFSQGTGALTLFAPGLSGRLPKIADKIGMLKPLAGPHGDQGTIFWVNNIMLYKQGKHPAETKEFLEWWSEHQKDLWTKGHVTQLPVRKSFAADPYFQGNAETRFILENYVPIGKTTATHAAEIFPKLNEVEGEGVMQTLMQKLLQGQDVTASVKAAASRLDSIMEE
ncbi:MAG: sugar ABC transporter substrate-binding protein [Verrucomicrobia bacterium]|nr:sugar ABC transporter substrate-binding protein [Verrucomicrobiota bacterium]